MLHVTLNKEQALCCELLEKHSSCRCWSAGKTHCLFLWTDFKCHLQTFTFYFFDIFQTHQDTSLAYTFALSFAAIYKHKIRLPAKDTTCTILTLMNNWLTQAAHTASYNCFLVASGDFFFSPQTNTIIIALFFCFFYSLQCFSRNWTSVGIPLFRLGAEAMWSQSIHRQQIYMQVHVWYNSKEIQLWMQGNAIKCRNGPD